MSILKNDFEMLSRGTNRYKGNLHSHTVNSDGRLTPVEAVKLYKEHGYAFLCFSEHDRYTDYRSEFNTKDFIILPGLEASAVLLKAKGDNSRLKVHHIHGILATSKQQDEAKEHFEHMEYVEPVCCIKEWDGVSVGQQVCDNMRRHGCITTYNHPIWSRVDAEDFVDIEGITAIEIFNYNTVNESGTGYDTTYWDKMLRSGKKIWAVATDDNHNGGIFDDACGGYIVVQAKELTQDDIIEAIMEGSYYSSSGPLIHCFGVRDNKVYVECSDVYRINFIVGNLVNDGISYICDDFEKTINHGEYELKGHESYVRVECVDKYGRCAWSNPIFLNM